MEEKMEEKMKWVLWDKGRGERVKKVMEEKMKWALWYERRGEDNRRN